MIKKDTDIIEVYDEKLKLLKTMSYKAFEEERSR